MELGQIDGFFVAPRFHNNLRRLMRGLEVFHCFDELGIEFFGGELVARTAAVAAGIVVLCTVAVVGFPLVGPFAL